MKKLFKSVIAALLFGGILMSCSCTSCNPEAFGELTKIAEYKEEYGESIKALFDHGLIDASRTELSPDGQMTNAEAVMLTARLHADLNEKKISAKDGEWYAPYYAYAESNSIVAEADNAEEKISRSEFASLLSAAIGEKLEKINDIEKIPDVDSNDSGNAILALYNAGITLGQDRFGYFHPENTLTYAECAELVDRVYGEKLAGTFDISSTDDAYALVINTSWNGPKEGIASGWQLDNRGGVPKTSLYSNYGTLYDISDIAGTALIREFNRIDTGIIDMYSKLTTDGKDGGYMEFRNASGESIYRVEIADSAWQLVIGGQKTRLFELTSLNEYEFRISLDLDNAKVKTVVNNTDLGYAKLAASGDALNLAEFRYATTAAGKTILTPLVTTMTANYAVFEDFKNPVKRSAYGWSMSKAKAADDVLTLEKNGNAEIAFAPVNNTAIVEFMFKNVSNNDMSVTVGSKENTAFVFSAKNGAFSVNGQEVYKTNYNDLWYRAYFELDFSKCSMNVKINGRYVLKDAAFADQLSSVTVLTVSNIGARTELDNFKVYRTYEREDYVPVPVVPKDSNGYTVGMNVCSLWRNGNYSGWSCITPYDDPQPVLGYYDEGLPETADWELKYIIEHGIDFQAFCIYMDKEENVAQKPATEHLYNGFMNAKYSDMSKFCVIWECANAGSPHSLDEWKNNYVPYFIENYFKDPRYVTLDNKLLLCVFGDTTLAKTIGGESIVKEAFDYLEEEVKKLGYGGMVYLSCGTANNGMRLMGFDGSYAYNWGRSGYEFEVNKSAILNSAKFTPIYTVPTISVGFNDIPWSGKREPMMSMDDYARSHEWVKTEYLPKYAKEEWQKNFVMLSTWNEYGEGTYIMPTTDKKGFGYIDIIRETYTDEVCLPSLNSVPTAEQLYRINRLYPQGLRLLRKNGSYKPEASSENKYESLYKVDLLNQSIVNYTSNISNIKYDENGVSGVSSSHDPVLAVNNITKPVDLEEVSFVRIRAKLEKGSVMQFFFTTNRDGSWTESKGRVFPASTGDSTFNDYYLRVDDIATMTGKLTGLRVDPTQTSGTYFAISSVELLKELPSMILDDTLTIDGNEYKQSILPAVNAAGEVTVAFDPAIGLDFALNCYHRWDKANGKLTLYFLNHTIAYTVGKDTYLLDGNEKTLGCKLETADSLPMIPLKQLCIDVGYGYVKSADGKISVITYNCEYFKRISESYIENEWNFDIDGYEEGWRSQNMNLLAHDGYLSCETSVPGSFPLISYSKDVSLKASDYKKLEIKVRYNYENSGIGQIIKLYFATDKSPNMSEDKCIYIKHLTENDTANEWRVFTFDLTAFANWKDTITKLRFDPFKANGHMDIDYIKFVK